MKKSDYFFLGKVFQSDDKSEKPALNHFLNTFFTSRKKGVEYKINFPRLLLRKVFQSDEISENPRKNMS